MNRAISLMAAVAVAGVTDGALAGATPPTFSGDVAPIIYKKCTVCHRPESSGPFPFITYADVKRRAATIRGVLDSGYMPPWKPVDHGIAFANPRSLTEREGRTIKGWIEAGCPEGDRDKAPAPPRFPDGWALGKPDLVVKMAGQFQVPADGPDIYRSFVFRLNLPEDKWVKAVELRPRAKSAVHHAIFFLDPTGNARKLNGADGKTGISGMGFLANFGGGPGGNRPPLAPGKTADTGGPRPINALARGLGGYVPGATPNRLPGDLAMPLPKGSDIVMQTHFHPSGKMETEQAELALHFADRAPTRQIVSVMIPPMFGFGSNIRVPAGEKNFRVTDSFTLPVDARAVGVAGHAHYICREMKMTAKSPTGETKVLLHIDDWDLDWQDQYQFAKPIDLPAGTVLQSEIIYDNSADNPENPHRPPREIRWGRGSTDEMGSLTLMTVAKRPGDGPKLQAGFTKYTTETFLNRRPDEFVKMLLQLDDDHDGKLQRSEAPPRLNTHAFSLMDTNKDGALDATELARVIKLLGGSRR